MRLHRNVTVAMAALLAILPALGGCAAEALTEASPAKKACIELMEKVPIYYEDFEFWYVRTLRNDPDLSALYEVWYERKVKSLEERFGIDGSAIDYLAQGEGLLSIVKTEYDIDTVRDRIEADFYRDTSYENMEVWKSEPSHDPRSATGGLVLSEGLFVRGANNSNVDDYVRVFRGEEISMYDRNAADVLGRLPQGIRIGISRPAYPKGILVSGMSVKKEEGNTLNWSNVYKFESPEDVKAAEEYFKSIEDDWEKAQSAFAERGEPSPFRSFTMRQDGPFMEWSALLEQKYLIALLFYG